MRLALAPVLLASVLLACEDPAAPSGTCLGPQVFAADTTVSGVAFIDDCTAPNGTFGDVYQFTVAAQTNILFTMTAGTLDSSRYSPGRSKAAQHREWSSSSTAGVRSR